MSILENTLKNFKMPATRSAFRIEWCSILTSEEINDIRNSLISFKYASIGGLKRYCGITGKVYDTEDGLMESILHRMAEKNFDIRIAKENRYEKTPDRMLTFNRCRFVTYECELEYSSGMPSILSFSFESDDTILG
jgi:hypothetical protein